MDSRNLLPFGVVNPEAVLSAFGFWPSFHDSEVHRVVLNRGTADEPPSVSLVVHAFATDSTVDEKGYFRVVTSVLVTLQCLDVSESELHDLGPQNVLSCLVFEAADSERVRITLGPCYGLSGSVVCRQVRVESVVPWRSPTADAPPVRNRPPL